MKISRPVPWGVLVAFILVAAATLVHCTSGRNIPEIRAVAQVSICTSDSQWTKLDHSEKVQLANLLEEIIWEPCGDAKGSTMNYGQIAWISQNSPEYIRVPTVDNRLYWYVVEHGNVKVYAADLSCDGDMFRNMLLAMSTRSFHGSGQEAGTGVPGS